MGYYSSFGNGLGIDAPCRNASFRLFVLVVFKAVLSSQSQLWTPDARSSKLALKSATVTALSISAILNY
jgi:hypothetical protein